MCLVFIESLQASFDLTFCPHVQLFVLVGRGDQAADRELLPERAGEEGAGGPLGPVPLHPRAGREDSGAVLER